MFLKSLDMYGFKSFADKTHIDFSEGITTLLGPNGCGKSNIVDAIKWVLGEQGTKTLRASKMEDVIFNGNDKRKSMPFAEVALTIDNSTGRLKHPASEIEIKRRIFRTGDTEYYMNRERCRLREIKELLMDTGVGKSAYSVLEQGRIDQIISMRPEDRRYIFEEAAGISKFKQQINEANNKIQKTEENITIVETTVAQVRRTYNRTKDQAEKAKKFRELNKRGFELEVQNNVCKIKTFLDTKEQRRLLIGQLKEEVDNLNSRLETFDSDLAEETRLFSEKNEKVSSLRIRATEIMGEMNNIASSINFIQERMNEYSIQENSYKNRSESLNKNLAIMSEQYESLDDKIAEAEERFEEVNLQLESAKKSIAESNEKIEKNTKEIEEKERENDSLSDELLRLSDELKDVIENLIKEVDENTEGDYSKERSEKAEGDLKDGINNLYDFVSARLDFIKSIKADSLSRKKEEEDYLRIKNELEMIKNNLSSFISSIPPVVDILLSPEGLMGKKKEISEREKSARKKSEENRIFITNTRALNEKLRENVESLREMMNAFSAQSAQYSSDIQRHKDMKESISSQIEERRYEVEENEILIAETRKKIQKANDDLKDYDRRKKEASDNLKEVNETQERLNKEIAEQGAKLQRMRGEKEEMLAKIDQDKKNIESHELYIGVADQQIEDVYTSFHTQFNRSLNEFKEYFEMDLDPTLIYNELMEINRKKESAGNINYLAEDEFNDAKTSLEFYTKQLDDLFKAKSDLQKVLEEVEATSKELFMKTYKAISVNFQNMFTRLFGGGKAQLTLQDEEDVLNTGVEIFAQPPGKKPTQMSLLSGGERSMTAVALLFATYQEKPSPFCILDEIDAALDDRNIGYFISVLEDFGKESQFIIITHNKHTVTAGESMLGVTQEEAGVSKTVSYRLKSIEGEPVILDENNREIGELD